MPFAQYARRSYTTPKTEEPYAIDPVQRQVENAKLRISDSGYQPKTSDRNWFERLTNLPEKQNAFLDILELLNRPTQGVMNVLNESRYGSEKIGTAFLHGLTGKDKVSGVDLVKKSGVNNKVGQFILGTGMEILLDPLNLIPGGVIVKGASKLGKGIGKGVRAVENAVPAVKAGREIVEPVARSVKDAAGKVFVPQYGWERTLAGETDDTLKQLYRGTQKDIRVQSEDAFKNVADIAKTTGIEAGADVGRLMESPLKTFGETKGYKLPDGTIVNNADDVKTAIKAKQDELNLIQTMLKDPTRVKALKNTLPADQTAFNEFMDIAGNRLKSDEAKNRVAGLRQEIKDLYKTLNNPVPVKQEIPRPTATKAKMNYDPVVKEAAIGLVKSNNELRQWALENGVNIDQINGYMTHILSAEERKLRKKMRALPNENFFGRASQPNKKILNERMLSGSAEEINERVGRKLFEPNAYFSTAMGQKRLIEYVNSVNFRRQVLSNPNFAKKYVKGEIVSDNAVIIDSNNYKFMKDEVLEELGIKDEVGGEYVVTKGAKEALDRYKQLTTDEGVNAFLKAFDTAQSAWKRAALFSVPYHLRNDIGAKFNNWVAGMNVVDLAKYSADADKEVYNAIIKEVPSELYQEYRNQGLSSSALSRIEFARRGEDIEKTIEKTIKKRSQLDGTLSGRLKAEAKDLKNPLNAFETSREFGDFIDQTNRFSLYKWAREKKKMAPEQAAELVNRVQFDYTNTTIAEREILTRMFPFYRWMRNNIPYQIRQFVTDPMKYSRINKVRLNAQEAAGIEDENVPQWMKENFAIAVQGDDQGSGKFLSMSLPLADLLKLQEPVKSAVDAATPLVKTPAELSLNRNFFFDSPIEKFEGQAKQFQIPGTDAQFGIPSKTAYALEQATGQIGRGFSQYLQRPEQQDQDIKFRTPSMGISSVIKDFDVDKAKYYEALDMLQRLQDQIDYIEQQTGIRPRTVNEIR